jgi:hypothetical protein
MISIRPKRALIALTLTFTMVCGCGGPLPAEFEVSNLTISPGNVEPYEAVTITAEVTNIGGLEGTCAANLSIDGLIVEVKDVTLEADEAEVISFSHTPEEAGEYTISIGELSDVLTVTAPPPGEYWTIQYVITSSEMRQVMSMSGAPPTEYSFELPPGTGMELRISKTIVNGSRDVFIKASSFEPDPITLEDVVPGIDTEIVWRLEEDAHGVLYVEDGIGDVDISSESTSGASPPTTYIIGDGMSDVAGSLLIPMKTEVAFTSLGISSTLPIDSYCTTGSNYNRITAPGKGIDGAEIEASGEHYARDGGPAPYVGTPGKLVVVGAIIDRTFMVVKVDIQFITEMEVAPAGWEQD